MYRNINANRYFWKKTLLTSKNVGYCDSNPESDESSLFQLRDRHLTWSRISVIFINDNIHQICVTILMKEMKKKKELTMYLLLLNYRAIRITQWRSCRDLEKI